MANLSSIKVDQLKWDSKANPKGFMKFGDDFEMMVRTLQHGTALADYVNEKLGKRELSHGQLIAPFIAQDSDFAEILQQNGLHVADTPGTPSTPGRAAALFFLNLFNKRKTRVGLT